MVSKINFRVSVKTAGSLKLRSQDGNLVQSEFAKMTVTQQVRKLLLVTYDINAGENPSEEEKAEAETVRECLIQYLRESSDWKVWHCLQSVWILMTHHEPLAVQDFLRRKLRADKDSLLVTPLSLGTQDWGLFLEEKWTD